MSIEDLKNEIATLKRELQTVTIKATEHFENAEKAKHEASNYRAVIIRVLNNLHDDIDAKASIAHCRQVLREALLRNET